MRIFKNKRFSQWAADEGIDDVTLKTAIDELARGLFEANLGGSVYKKRVARQNQGKRDGYRTLIAFKQDDKAIFVVGFAKNERANISDREKEALKRIAKDYLSATDYKLEKLIKTKNIIEVK